MKILGYKCTDINRIAKRIIELADNTATVVLYSSGTGEDDIPDRINSIGMHSNTFCVKYDDLNHVRGMLDGLNAVSNIVFITPIIQEHTPSVRRGNTEHVAETLHQHRMQVKDIHLTINLLKSSPANLFVISYAYQDVSITGKVYAIAGLKPYVTATNVELCFDS